MGQFYCQRCEQYDSSKNGDCIADPDDNWMMIHESCLSGGELAKAEAKRLVGEFLSTIDPILEAHRR